MEARLATGCRKNQVCYYAVGMKHPDATDISRSNTAAKE